MATMLNMQISWYSNSNRIIHQRVFRKKIVKIGWILATWERLRRQIVEEELWSKTIVSQVDLKAKLYLSFCLELQSAKSTYQHVDLDLHWWNTQRLEFYSRSSEVSRVFFNFQNDLQKQNWDQQDTKLT